MLLLPKFDKCTLQQVKKQYDGYIQYWWKCFQCIKISNCGTIMVDHCPVEKISEHFFEFVDKVKFQFQLMLHLGMSNWDLRNFWMLFRKWKVSTQASFRLVHVHCTSFTMCSEQYWISWTSVLTLLLLILTFSSNFLLQEEQITEK